MPHALIVDQHAQVEVKELGLGVAVSPGETIM
jgi:hypothetical protein